MSDGYGRSTEDFGIDRKSSVNLIVETALDNGVTDPRQIAYILATAQHESRNFTAPDEDYGRSQAIKLDYHGGEEYFGRGYVHLTHLRNYEKFDNLLGLNGELIKNPRLAKDPELAAKILVVGMRDGLFTGKRLSHYINEDTHDSYNARRTVNGITSASRWSIPAAKSCEQYAQEWESEVPALVVSAKREREEVRVLQERLNKLGLTDVNGRALAENSLYTQQTREAVESFQRQHGLDVDGIAGPKTLSAVRLYASVPNPMYDAIEFAQQFQPGPHPPINLGAKQVIDGMPDYLRVNHAHRQMPSHEQVQTHTQAFGQSRTQAYEHQHTDAPATDPAQARMAELQREMDVLRRQMQHGSQSPHNGLAPRHEADPHADSRSAAIGAPSRSRPERESEPEPPQPRQQRDAQAFPTSHRDYALFEAIRQQLPDEYSDDMAAHATLEARRGGINRPDQIRGMAIENGQLTIMGKSGVDFAFIELAAYTPPLQETLQQTATFDQQQAYDLAQFQEQQQQMNMGRGPSMTL